MQSLERLCWNGLSVGPLNGLNGAKRLSGLNGSYPRSPWNSAERVEPLERLCWNGFAGGRLNGLNRAQRLNGLSAFFDLVERFERLERFEPLKRMLLEARLAREAHAPAHSSQRFPSGSLM